LEGHVAKEATLKNITLLSPTNSVQEVIDILLAGSEKDFVVLENEKIVGVLTQKAIIENAKKPSLLVGAIMDETFRLIDASTAITIVLESIGKEKKDFFPVTEEGTLIGAIDRTNISEFILLKTSNS
jgi:predicted transcriptional regulator